MVRYNVNKYCRGKTVMFENIVWSEESCTLNTFIESYPLPQLVKVEEGIYGAEEAETLSKDDILTLHFTKRTDKLLVEAADHKQYFVPLNCPCKVEILPRICQDRYYSVEDVVDAWTSADFKFIRVVHNGPPQLRIREGDILKLRKTVEEKRVKFLECEFHDKTKDPVRLPLDFKAAFEPLASVEQYHLGEVLKKLPVRAKFTSCDTTIQGAHYINVDLSSLGSVLLKESREERTVIATSRNDNLVTVLMIPTDLDVNVFPALGAVIGDKEYARFCKDIHDGTELTKVDFSKNDSIMFEEPTVDVIHDYVEVKPPLPRRKHRDSNQSDNSDYSDDYQDVEGPLIERPPRPPKPQPKPKHKPKPLVSVPQYENMQADSEFTAPTEKPQSFPDDLGNLSVSRVGECLRMLNMGEHVERFESEQIDGQLFITLNEGTLPCLGVSNKLQQQKLLKFVQGWRPNTN